MKKLAVLAVFASALAFGQAKKVVGSDISWWGYKVAKSASTSHTGKVKLKSGSVQMKGNEVSGGTFVLDMNSIGSTDLEGDRKGKLDEHLKNGDFFEVDKYPTATYKITSVQRNNDKIYNYKVNGNLTVKGKTQVVSFPAKIQYSKGVVSIVSDKFSFNRQKFDVAYQSSMKDVMISDSVDMLVKLTAK